jgi:hypothetical protein
MAHCRRKDFSRACRGFTCSHVGSTFAANRAVAVWSKAFAWGATRGLVPEGLNPAKGLQKYREQGRERYLTRDELAALGDALRLAETDGLPYAVDETGPKSKHAPKPENRKRKLDRTHPGGDDSALRSP